MVYFIEYTIIIVPIVPSLPSSPISPIPYGKHPTPLFHVHGSGIEVLWLLPFLYCTLYPHGYSASTNLYFLIPSPLYLFPHIPSHLTNIKTLSVSMILSVLVFLVCFLDSVADSCKFIVILMSVSYTHLRAHETS